MIPHPTLSSRSKAFDASFVHVDVCRVRETQVDGQEEECGHVTSDGNGAGLSDAALYAWAESMFAGGSDASVALGGEPVCETPTVGLCIRCKAAVIKL